MVSEKENEVSDMMEKGDARHRCRDA